MNKRNERVWGVTPGLVAATLLMYLVTVACSSSKTAAPPKAPPYTPRFAYPSEQSPEKLDVTVGLVNPQWGGNGAEFYAENKKDSVVKSFIGGLRTSVNELLSNKGFNITGPFHSVDDMTFPEKKSADFVVYLENDIAGGLNITNMRQETVKTTSGEGVVTVCEAAISVGGTISIIAKEPLSGEKMWVKRIEIPEETKPIDLQSETYGAIAKICNKQATTSGSRDDWGRMHVAMFQRVMKAMDKYINGEEFQVLKKQAAELRAKKTY